MDDVAATIEEARRQLEAGEERRAAQLLGEAAGATDDPALLEQVHALAVEGHDRASGFRKIHWNELVLATEARLAQPV